MVSIERRYCIDRYEFPNRKGAVPFAGVTWLEAAAKCKAAGKRLCSGSEWERACSGSSQRTYPYGDAFGVQRCNSGREHTRGATPGGYRQDCKSEEGVYDLSGNLWEWTGLQAQEAALAGGSWMTDGDNSKCSSRSWQGVPNASNFTYGFRCCASLIPSATE
jgi:formylglycine-generating enzyme required for sulfatase activity